MGITAVLGLLLTGMRLQSAALMPGVVVDSQAGLVFCSNAERQVTALKLDSGKPVWTATEKGWPLAVMGSDLVVATLASDPHAFYLKVLGSADGKFRLMSKPVILANWAKPALNYDNTSGYEFRIWAEPSTEAKIQVFWMARKWDDGGIVPKPGMGLGRNAVQHGAVEFHVGSGYLSDLEAPEVAPTFSSTLQADGFTLNLAERPAKLNEPHPLELVYMTSGSEMPAWKFSLGLRAVPRLRM